MATAFRASLDRESDSDPECITCSDDPDVGYVHVRELMPDFDHYVLEIKGPRVPITRLRSLSNNETGI